MLSNPRVLGRCGAAPEDIPEDYGPAETEYCQGLSHKLLARVEARVKGGVSKDDFAAASKAWAEALCDTPGGLDLVQMVLLPRFLLFVSGVFFAAGPVGLEAG